MQRWLLALTVLSSCTLPAFTAPLHAGAPAGTTADKILLEYWDAAYLGDGKAGYVHTIAKETSKDGEKLIHTTVEVRLTVKRFNETIQLAMDSGTLETLQGKVVGVFMRQYQGKEQQLQINGTVVNNQLQLVMNGKTPLKPAPWNQDVVGLYKQQWLNQEHQLKPGEKFTFQSFEPTINLVLKTEVSAKGWRDIELKGSRTRQKTLLIETIPAKIEFKQGEEMIKVQLPISQTWLNEKLEPLKSEVEIPSLGPIVTYRTSRAQALAPGPVAQLTDIGTSQLVRLKNRILDPYGTSRAVYQVTIRNEVDVSTTFARDHRQQIKKVQGNTFELHVSASKGDVEERTDKEPGAEFLQSSYFINCDDALVKKHTIKAVGNETDSWKKAVRIERWVHENMRVTNHEALATSDHVARTLEGDCTEYSMLTAAMCRAAGVPSRTAIGLIYADIKGAPCFAFHMWTEVYAREHWIPIDATLGKGYVGATHLKITDNSWHDERTMTPIFPVIRVVGRLNINVLGVENR